MILQIIRRSVQSGVLIVVVGVGLLSLYAHYRAAHVIDDPDLMKSLRGEVITQAIHPYVEKLDDPQAFLDGHKGTVWSMRLFGVSLSDPLAAAEAIATTKHIHWPLIVSIIMPVVLTVLLGRVFCSWICPGYVLFEITGKLRRLLRVAEIRPGEVRFAFANKYIFLLVGLIMAAVLSAPLFAMIYPPAVISRTVHAWIFGTELVGMLVLLGIIVAFEMLVSPRWWCRTMCPGGALYGLLGWLRPVRIRLRGEACTGCKECIPVCEAGINPITQSGSIECDNCGVCLRHCGPDALYYTIGLPDILRRSKPRGAKPRSQAELRAPVGDARSVIQRRLSSQTRPSPRPSPCEGEGVETPKRRIKSVVRILALTAPLVFVAPASAHHILGLPHYSYKENYPQRPTLEYPATTGPYDILLTSYPGIPNPGEPANLAFYIKNRDTKRSYADPVSIRILETSTFGDSKVLLPRTERPPFDNEHKFQFVFPADGEFIVELTLMVEGREEVIPFLMVAGEPTATASWAVAGSFLAVFGFIVVRAVQKKRQRRASRRALPVIAAAREGA